MSQDYCTPTSTDLGNRDHLLRSSFNLFTYDQIAYTDVINLDMAKAFYKVAHEKPLCKLVGVRDPVLAWLWSYLANRRHRAVIDGFASDWKYVALVFHRDPLLALSFSFFIFKNDIADDISTSILLYADDAKCYKKLLDPTEYPPLCR